MSNSIWKMPDVKPDIDKQIIIKNDFDYIIYFGKCAVAPGNKWAYIDDLIAQADKAERLQKQLDATKKYADSLRNRVEKMLKKNKTLKNTAADYFMKSIELGIELEKTKSNN